MGDQIDLIVADLTRYSETEMIDLAIEINANLRSSPPEGTPRDLGWASANWTLSVRTPFVNETPKVITAAEVSAQQAVAAQGENDVLNYHLADGPIFASNNVPYIGPLNDGHSKQSPAGFIQAAVNKAITRAERGQPVLGND